MFVSLCRAGSAAIAAVVFGLSLVPVRAAAQAPSPSASPEPEATVSATPSHLQSLLNPAGSPLPAHPAGSIDGVITTVNYGAGELTVLADKHRSVKITVLPSTTIAGPHGEFFTFSNLRRGVRVHVVMNERGDIFVAQIIDVIK